MKRIVVCAGAFVVLVTAGYFLFESQEYFFDEEVTVSADTLLLKQPEAPKPIVLFGIEANELNVSENVVKSNQRFTDLLAGYFVSPEMQRQLISVPRETFDFRKISANRKYTVLSSRDSVRSLKAFVYEPNAIDYFVFHFTDSFRVEAGHREIVTKEQEVAGVIGSSLSETIETLGISPDLTNRFVDIFAWQVDFQHLQKGDRFKLFYDELTVDGLPVGIGKISGIYFEHYHHPYYAIPFDQGDGLDYFDAEGKSLRKALLKYPIEFTRISSRYNLNRFHPVAKVYRAHLGTDFAAPYGTPIRSVGDGIVLEAQYKGGNGNYVKIRHNNTYTTQYLHMSKIGAGMRPGARVRQGETIGYVGSTGLATGPHVCYRFWRNGVQVDALKVELPPSQPVKSEFLDQFEKIKSGVTKRLDQIALPEPPLIVAAN